MFSSNISRLTTLMIYLGTLLISILSFFTTFKGLIIILSWELALLGSLGLQAAMLGIAWNLIKIKENRSSYVIAFSITAVFSIFFSYVNFDINIKSNTRPLETRSAYYDAAKPVLTQYALQAKQAALAARYQVDRLAGMIEMERDKGWATIIDEGSRDKFIQSIIDGARLTVESWRKSTGADYRQGKGRGIIVNYLESQQRQAESNLNRTEDYVVYVDTLALKLNSDMMVEQQYKIVNKAYVNFPASVVGNITGEENPMAVPSPPAASSFAEKPANSQQALMMVIGDLYIMDRLSFLSLMLAFAIDFIVILIAFAGSHIMAKADFILDRIEDDTARRLKNVKLDDVDKFNQVLDANLQIYKKAAQYGKDLTKITEDYESTKNRQNTAAKSGSAAGKYPDLGSMSIIIKEKSRLAKWLSKPRRR